MTLKKRLEENKIFFEVLTPLVIGGVTFFLAYLTYNLQQAQTEILNREFLPQFVVESAISTSTPTTEIIHIYNHGGGFSAFTASPYSEYEIHFPARFDKAGPPTFVPLQDYFYFDFSGPFIDDNQNNISGLIKTIVSTTTAYDKVQAIQREYNIDAGRSAEYKFLSLNSYLVIAYTDIFGKRHVEYYFIFPGFSYRIPNDTATKIFNRRYELYLSTASINDDLDAILKKAREEKNRNFVERFFKYIEDRKNYYQMNEFYYRTTGCTMENLLECYPTGPG